MKIIWLGLFIEIAILSLIKPFIVNYEGVAILAILINIIFVFLILMSYKDKKKVLFFSAFLSRVVFMFWDMYATHIFVLPNSGADTESFYANSIAIANNLSLFKNARDGIYSQINGLLFYFIGPQRMVGQYVNVLLGLSTVFIIYRILLLLEIDSKVLTFILLIAAFFPNSMIMSAVFLREIFPTFFVAVSLYYFVKWFKEPKSIYIFLSLLFIGIASMFHSGVIGIVLGYIYGYLFYKKEQNIFRFSNRTITTFIIIVIIGSLGFTVLGDKMFKKFRNVDKFTDIYAVGTHSGSFTGSDYLKGLTISNPIQFILFAPIKTIFFLTAPLPINWRGLMDIFTFFTDSMLYLGTIIYYLKYKKCFGDRHAIVLSIVVMIIGASIIFGIGVSNAGTAVRHRQKLIPLFLVLLGVMMDGKHKFIYRDKDNLV